MLVLPFTKLFSDAVRIRERVIEAREEMEVRMIPTETAVYSPFLPSASSSVHELQGLVPEVLVRTIRTQVPIITSSNHIIGETRDSVSKGCAPPITPWGPAEQREYKPFHPPRSLVE